MIKVIPVKGIPIIEKEGNLISIILEAIKKNDIELQEKDILIIAQTIVSKSEDRIIDLKTVMPSEFAKKLSKKVKKDPRVIELILQESNSIIKIGGGKIITESRLGFICADAGIDRSNSPRGTVTLLPINPDKTADNFREFIKRRYNINVAIIITDTHGRPFREGGINVAIGVSGIGPILDYRGKDDLYNNKLLTTKVAIADELASAAELLMGESNEKIPVVIIRGYKYNQINEKNLSKKLIRRAESDLFR
ncbi:MAG: coenzyme F420-0:L-glutamate ligase [Candidatus Helarchaeota archaeon]